SPSISYQIKITSTNNASVSDYSDNYFSVVDVVAPAVPSGLSATAGDKQVVLTWSANSESDLKSYKVYGGTSANPTTLLSTVNAGTETYTHTGLTNGTKYYYSISSVDNSGNESSKTSDVNATPVLPGGGNALSFDGTDDYVKISDNAILDQPQKLTLSVWVKENKLSGHSVNYPSVFGGGHGGEWRLQYNQQTGKYDFGVKSGTWYDASVDATTNWQHLVGVYDRMAGKVSLYNNGTLANEITNVPNSNLDTPSLMWAIGGRGDGSSFNDCLIDEVAIWKDALTAAEITALYNSGTALDARTNSGDYASTDNLKGYWKMEDGSGTTLTDVSGYGNDGTIDGASWTTGRASTSYDNTPKIIG
ncbi:MAG: fibronectin type III domain-containing protein, partial [Anaerolineales bacterium]|nr:fibronectin type III domain-containing protein [Anaerolineales bacterium]